jgi:hypothetical protein
MFEVKHAFLNCHSGFSPARAQRPSVLILLVVVASMTTLCGGVAQAQAVGQTQAVAQVQPIEPPRYWTGHSLQLSGNLPSGTVNQPYNAVLSVDGGSAPYHFSVKTGVLPTGIGLNDSTGTLSGKPTTAGSFSFEVVVTDSSNYERGSRSFTVLVGGSSTRVTVSVSPTSTSLSSDQKQQFTAAVGGTSNTGATWSATSGSVSASGLFTAPTVSAKTNVVVTATSVADSSQSASAAITVEPATSQALQITTSNLPAGQQGSSYGTVFTATGGTAPYHWSISAGTPPAGITMNTNGDFAGTPTAVGTSSFTIAATDATNKTATSNFSVAVLAGGNFDGPAELPRVTVSSAMADTPAPGSTISVSAGGNLQSALDNANCGDTIALQAGATFTGTFYFQAKNCDNANWIIVRTSAPDSSLPAEGQRLTPCYAGVASLPGRPQYTCSTPRNVLAKLVVTDGGSVVVRFQPGANHYRLLGLELTRPTGTRGAPTLISLAPGGTAEYIVVDRSWLHGTAKDETDEGFSLDGTNYVAIVDSYFSDFHCTATTGACTDSHAMSGGLGRHQDGPYLIQNNFLEASGEAIMFGGGGATVTPTDITISSNHFFKPWQWMKGSPNFQGGDSGNPFIVKNHLELKNAIRVLAEDNLMENVWGGFSQTGYAIVLTPKNQHLVSGQDVCPVCQVTDVTVRYTHIAHAGAGICMATSISGNGANGAAALAGTRWSIHDVVMDDISTHYDGSGNLFEVMNNWPTNSLNTVAINHITGFPDSTSHLMFIGNRNSYAPMYGFVFSDNIVTTSAHPVWGTGGGPTTCAFDGTPAFKISHCFNTYTFAGNVLIGTPSAFPPDSWPTGNFFPSDPSSIFVQYNNGSGGNYQIQSSSPYLNQGTDGRSPGADIVGLDAALAGVE